MAFVSGPLTLTPEEFEKHYRPAIDKAIEVKHKFVIGNARGADTMALEYILRAKYPPENILICIFVHDVKRRAKLESGYRNRGLQVADQAYKSDEERDAAMTAMSTYDIAHVRPPEEARRAIEAEGKKYDPTRLSGTQKNILRRVAKA